VKQWERQEETTQSFMPSRRLDSYVQALIGSNTLLGLQSNVDKENLDFNNLARVRLKLINF